MRARPPAARVNVLSYQFILFSSEVIRPLRGARIVPAHKYGTSVLLEVLLKIERLAIRLSFGILVSWFHV